MPPTIRRRTRKAPRRHRRTLRRRQRGGLIENYQAMFNDLFEDRWVLTGSEAVRLYNEYLGLGQFYHVQPNDVDIIFVHRGEFRDNNFYGFQRRQDRVTRSMTFENPVTQQSFDVTVQPTPALYYEINGVRLMNPRVMLENYEDNLTGRTQNQQAANTIKINALRNIIANLAEINIQPQRIDAERRPPPAYQGLQGMRLFG